MLLKPKWLLLLLLIFSGSFVEAQEDDTKQDSVALYRKIEEYSSKRKFTKFVHGLIFEPLSTKTVRSRNRINNNQNFKDFHGKVIRKINISTLDPFGYSEIDTVARPRRRLSSIGNRLHLKTKELTIWNLLLIRENRPLDSLLVKESERLIRSQRYVRRVKITPHLISRESDSVDVEIRVLDSWSLVPDFAGSTSRMTAKLTERNFLGFGHQVDNTYRKDFDENSDAYSVKYTVPNIMNTYIRTTLTYDIDPLNNYAKSIDIERPFFSPFARWAGGVFVGNESRMDSLPNLEGNLNLQPFKFGTTDVWGGHAINIFDGLSEDERTTNLITTLRYMKINYHNRPDAAHDPVDFFNDETLMLTGIGVASRQFVEDKYLFNYGIIEDVPTGTAVSITGGFQNKNYVRRPYFGFRASTGKYFRLGYISTNFEYGTFVRNGSSEQGAISIQTNYFTKLLEIGSWKLRQFAKAQMVIGNDRVASQGDYLTLNEHQQGISGFDTRNLFGTKKWVATFQTQSYSPWDAWGFRLNPFFNYTMGMLGNASEGFNNSRLYSQIGVGVIISNDYLVFSTFQLSFSFYPVIPDQGVSIFKTNALRTDDFGFQDFSINKPKTVHYE